MSQSEGERAALEALNKSGFTSKTDAAAYAFLRYKEWCHNHSVRLRAVELAIAALGPRGHLRPELLAEDVEEMANRLVAYIEKEPTAP